jgi:CubicO group peptidase (beta-lactamase class C family)
VPVSRSFAQVEAELQRIVRETSIPSASLCVVTGGWEAIHATFGFARLDPPRPAWEDQPYDLASLTKALAGSTVVASLIEEGRMALDQSAADVLPELDPRITLHHLLTHGAGFPKWNSFYSDPETAWGLTETRASILNAARRTRIDADPGTRHTYTDIGFLILLAWIEAVTERPFEVEFRRRVLEPAGVDELRWGWPGAAATEKCPVRGIVVEGTVHDLNAAALGGVSTHAGLFGPARAVARLGWRLAEAVENPAVCPGLPGRALRTMWQLRGPGSHCGGWDTPSRSGYTSTGRYFPDDAVGHLGYTGTSLWIVPSRRTVVTLLTNRIHPLDHLDDIRQVRPRIHDAVAIALGWDQEST